MAALTSPYVAIRAEKNNRINLGISKLSKYIYKDVHFCQVGYGVSNLRVQNYLDFINKTSILKLQFVNWELPVT